MSISFRDPKYKDISQATLQNGQLMLSFGHKKSGLDLIPWDKNLEIITFVCGNQKQDTTEKDLHALQLTCRKFRDIIGLHYKLRRIDLKIINERVDSLLAKFKEKNRESDAAYIDSNLRKISFLHPNKKTKRSVFDSFPTFIKEKIAVFLIYPKKAARKWDKNPQAIKDIASLGSSCKDMAFFIAKNSGVRGQGVFSIPRHVTKYNFISLPLKAREQIASFLIYPVVKAKKWNKDRHTIRDVDALGRSCKNMGFIIAKEKGVVRRRVFSIPSTVARYPLNKRTVAIDERKSEVVEYRSNSGNSISTDRTSAYQRMERIRGGNNLVSVFVLDPTRTAPRQYCIIS